MRKKLSRIIIFTISYSLMFVKPVSPKKSTQSWQWQFDGFHFRIFFLKDDKVLAFLISAGIEFQITGPKYRIEPLPNLTELILGIQSFWGPFDLKPYNDSFNWNSSEKIRSRKIIWCFEHFYSQILNILFMNSKSAILR